MKLVLVATLAFAANCGFLFQNLGLRRQKRDSPDEVSGFGKKIRGAHSNSIRGESNMIKGNSNYNAIKGKLNFARGNANGVFGHKNSVQGSGNLIGDSR